MPERCARFTTSGTPHSATLMVARSATSPAQPQRNGPVETLCSTCLANTPGIEQKRCGFIHHNGGAESASQGAPRHRFRFSAASRKRTKFEIVRVPLREDAIQLAVTLYSGRLPRLDLTRVRIRASISAQLRSPTARCGIASAYGPDRPKCVNPDRQRSSLEAS